MKKRFFPPRLIIPATFTDCLTYEQQLLWLLTHKSDVLKAGDNITLTENDDGTITISAEGGGSEYTIQKTTSEGVVSYKLIDGDGTQHGDTIVVPPGHSYTIHEYEDEEEPGFLYELLNENGERCGDVIVMQNYDKEYRIVKDEDEEEIEKMYDIYRLVDKYGDEHGDPIEVPIIPEIHDYTIEGEQDTETGGWDYQLLEDEDPVGVPIHVPGPELPAGGDDGQVLKVIGEERELTWGYVGGATVYPRTEIMYYKHSDAKEIVEINRHAFSKESGFGTEISNDGVNHYTITFNDEGEYDGMVLKIRGTDGMVTFDDPTDKYAWAYPFVGDYVQLGFNVEVTTTPVSIGFTLDNGGYVTTDYYYELFRYGEQLNGGNTYDVLMKNSSGAGDYMWQSPYEYFDELGRHYDASGRQHKPFNDYVSRNYHFSLIDTKTNRDILTSGTLNKTSASLGVLARRKIMFPTTYTNAPGTIVQRDHMDELFDYTKTDSVLMLVITPGVNSYETKGNQFIFGITLADMYFKQFDESIGGDRFRAFKNAYAELDYFSGSDRYVEKVPCTFELFVRSINNQGELSTTVEIVGLLSSGVEIPSGASQVKFLLRTMESLN